MSINVMYIIFMFLIIIEKGYVFLYLLYIYAFLFAHSVIISFYFCFVWIVYLFCIISILKCCRFDIWFYIFFRFKLWCWCDMVCLCMCVAPTACLWWSEDTNHRGWLSPSLSWSLGIAQRSSVMGSSKHLYCWAILLFDSCILLNTSLNE